ncbi:hypothetical protein AMS68_007034 [Peltaster fructicola]|uniref:Heterokaryon incompatibility domain-containing protein n=1 Tax=Peltaster fructicola TaxID=286661 RepID=A0A6H0Y3D2_9PEZI|nr:hypothetical protein AMS68_007034 [Peltaster fructicola]
MRLLNTTSFKFEWMVRETCEYAILSHRWIEEEVGDEITFATLEHAKTNGPTSRQAASWSKMEKACEQARNDRLKYIWIDTICIDKNDIQELGRSLNSMFDWYARAKICYVYLQDAKRTIQRAGTNYYSEWFERGWTLQELLAPSEMVFYDMDWCRLGTRTELAPHLSNASKIDVDYLKRPGSFREASVATKMSWMAGRSTKYVEDITFSMLGILNVKLPYIPAEGAQAFFRLQSELLKSEAFDESLFAWSVPADKHLRCYEVYKNRQLQQEWLWSPPDNRWGLLAPSPDCFVSRWRIDVDQDAVVPRIRGGFQEKSLGVTVEVPLKFVMSRLTGMTKSKVIFPLNCWRWNEQLKKRTNIVLRLERTRNATAWTREECDTLGPLAKGWGSAKDWNVKDNCVMGIDQQLAGSITVRQPMFKHA